jgi:hypothetical protein
MSVEIVPCVTNETTLVLGNHSEFLELPKLNINVQKAPRSIDLQIIAHYLVMHTLSIH